MAISLNSLRRSSVTAPPLILIYGVAGMGKTTLALDCPDTVYLQIAPESPPRGIETTSFGEMTTYAQVMESLVALYTEEHKFKHIVIDSIDALEKLVWKETCLRNKWVDLEAPGYGKGYLAADHVWADFVEGCNALRRDKGIGVTWLALAHASNHEEPGKQPYKRYDLRLHQRALNFLTQAAEAVLFINTKVDLKETEAGFGKKSHHAEGGGTRWLFADVRPAFVAKNRFGMPDAMIVPRQNPWGAIAKFLSGNGAVIENAAEKAAA